MRAARLVLAGPVLKKTADEFNMRDNTWSQYETGKRLLCLFVAMRFCERYGTTLDWFYRGSPSGLPLEHAQAILDTYNAMNLTTEETRPSIVC